MELSIKHQDSGYGMLITMEQRYRSRRHQCTNNGTMQKREPNTKTQVQAEKKEPIKVGEIKDSERQMENPEKSRDKIFKQEDMASFKYSKGQTR